MNISHLVETEILNAARTLKNKKEEIDNSDMSDALKILEKLRLPSVHHIILINLIKDAELFTDENKLVLMDAMIEMNKDAIKYHPWTQK